VDDRWFTNVAGFGFDVAVLQATQRIARLRGPAVYVAAALGELFGYAGLDTRVSGLAGRVVAAPPDARDCQRPRVWRHVQHRAGGACG
jgi:hypothetical protein